MNKHTIIQVGSDTQIVNSGDEVNVYGHIYIAQDHGDNLTLVYDRPEEEPAPKFEVGNLVTVNNCIFICEVITINPDKTYEVRPKAGTMQINAKEEDLTLYETKLNQHATEEKQRPPDFLLEDIVLAGEMKAVSKIVEINPDGTYVIQPEGLNMTFEVKKEDLILHKRKSPPMFRVDDTVFVHGFMCVVTEVHANSMYTVRTIDTNDIYTKKESELIIHRRAK